MGFRLELASGTQRSSLSRGNVQSRHGPFGQSMAEGRSRAGHTPASVTTSQRGHRINVRSPSCGRSLSALTFGRLNPSRPLHACARRTRHSEGWLQTAIIQTGLRTDACSHSSRTTQEARRSGCSARQKRCATGSARGTDPAHGVARWPPAVAIQPLPWRRKPRRNLRHGLQQERANADCSREGLCVGASDPTWSPDGRRIATLGYSTHGLYVGVRASGRDVKPP